jgi:hypothetical protein
VDAIVRHVDRRNMLWRIGMLKRLLILIGWYRDEIGNRLEVKPSHQIVDSNSHASDVARSTQAAGSPILLLKQAPRATVKEAIKAAYDVADAAGGEPPNIKELPAAVQPLLEQRGYGASARANCIRFFRLVRGYPSAAQAKGTVSSQAIEILLP